jgi:hypothetical protein
MEATPKQDSSPATSNSSSSSTMNGSPAASPSPSSPSTTLSSSPSSSASVLDKEGHTPAEAAQGRPTPHGPSSPPSSSSPSSSSSSQSQSQSSNQQFDHDLDPEGIPEEELKIDLDIVEEELGDDLSAAELFRIFHESCREAKITPWHKVVSQVPISSAKLCSILIINNTKNELLSYYHRRTRRSAFCCSCVMLSKQEYICISFKEGGVEHIPSFLR